MIKFIKSLFVKKPEPEPKPMTKYERHLADLPTDRVYQNMWSHWTCPQCRQPLLKEEVDEIRESLTVCYAGEVEFRCEECGERLIAKDWGYGKVEVLEKWAW